MSDLSDHELDKLRPNGKSRQVRFRADPDEREAFDRAARMSGLTLSAWLRQVAREAADRRYASAGLKTPWMERK